MGKPQVRHCGRHWCGTMATRIIELGGVVARRRFSDDDKARIVSEAMMPGANVADVGRRHRVCSSLIYRWRRRLLRDGLAAGAALPAPCAPTFVPVELTGVAAPGAVQPEPLAPGAVELVGTSGRRVRLAPPVDARVLKVVLAGLT